MNILSHVDVELCQGTQGVVLSADSNLLDLYELEVVGGTLRIGIKSGCSISSKAKTLARVSAPQLSGISISGSGNCTVPEAVSIREDFSMNIAGSGNIRAAGLRCRSLSVKIGGSGNVSVGALAAENASVKINGSGNVRLKCEDAGDMAVKINGSGNVILSGTARSLGSKVNGSGRVNSSSLQLASAR